ncbi:hypothetical protein GCM10010350_74310 [Streptomyces galilaeus]|nr:hypothetical protein GCM10010350_74310 [Streptomyces galilaeus]
MSDSCRARAWADRNASPAPGASLRAVRGDAQASARHRDRDAGPAPPRDPAATALAYAELNLLVSTPSFTRWTQEHDEEMRDGPAFYTEIEEAAATTAAALANGHWTMMPPAGTPTVRTDPAFAARILMLTEADQLREARTYSIGPNTTGLAVAAAAGSPPQESISVTRPPSPSGLIQRRSRPFRRGRRRWPLPRSAAHERR